MGVILKELPALNALAFDGWGPEPELRAHELLEAWKTAHPETGTPGRLFGHNLTAEGTLAFGPSHAGYRLLLTVPAPDGQTTVALEPGRFAVTGIEGSFADDPAGAWITAGWARMTALAAEKGYRLKEQGRWFEEELEPRTPGNLRLDLYVELEGGKD